MCIKCVSLLVIVYQFLTFPTNFLWYKINAMIGASCQHIYFINILLVAEIIKTKLDLITKKKKKEDSKGFSSL